MDAPHPLTKSLHPIIAVCVLSPTQYGLTPLMMATMHGKVAAANVLLEAGADVNIQSNDVRSNQ